MERLRVLVFDGVRRGGGRRRKGRGGAFVAEKKKTLASKADVR
jgi:hypothetical protein